jgi:hypothetical protein
VTTVITTRSNPKKFAWSYSKLKNFEVCPKRHYNIDIAKTVKEEESEQLQYGNALHKALAEAVSGKAPLPKPFEGFQKLVDKIAGVSNGNVTILVEQQLAIRDDLTATSWFGKDAWYRGIADVIKIAGPVALVIDYKTGKIIEDGVQLALMAQCVFAHHPEVQKIRTEFWWLKDDAETRADFTRDDMVKVWAGLLPRVKMLEEAHAAANFPPKPGHLCRKWCPVEACQHHGI